PYRAQAIELVVHRARLGRARIRALFVGEMNREDVPIRLFVLHHRVTLARVATEATRIDGEHVDARLTFDDPLRKLPAGATRRGDAEAVTFVDPQISHAPRGPDERTAIGRVRDRPVDDVLDAAVLERGHATNRRCDLREP